MRETRRSVARWAAASWMRALWAAAAVAFLGACAGGEAPVAPEDDTPQPAFTAKVTYLDPICQDIAARTSPPDPQKHAEQITLCDTMDIAVNDALGPAGDDPGNPWGTTRQERVINVRTWLVPSIRTEILCREPGSTCLSGPFAP